MASCTYAAGVELTLAILPTVCDLCAIPLHTARREASTHLDTVAGILHFVHHLAGKIAGLLLAALVSLLQFAGRVERGRGETATRCSGACTLRVGKQKNANSEALSCLRIVLTENEQRAFNSCDAAQPTFTALPAAFAFSATVSATLPAFSLPLS